LKDKRTVVVGIDAQKRGLALSLVDAQTGEFINGRWMPLVCEPLEKRVGEAYDCCFSFLQTLEEEYDILIIGIEYPTANVGTSSYILWLIAGAVVGAAANSSCDMIEGTVPLSWKKNSGLNVWARANDKANRGIIQKDAIKEGLLCLDPHVPEDLTPIDMYDSIAIARGTALYNLEKIREHIE
jgi:hypothetical protein